MTVTSDTELTLHLATVALDGFVSLQGMLKQTDNVDETTGQFYQANRHQIQATPKADLLRAVLLQDSACTVAECIRSGERIISYLRAVVTGTELQLEQGE